MAVRPVFIPKYHGIGVEEKPITFTWYAGLAATQKQKSVLSLHQASQQMGISSVLEISTKSLHPLGVALSAFNLNIKHKKTKEVFSVEAAFQSSKVFKEGGPYKDILRFEAYAAKKDPRLRASGELVAFDFFGYTFPSAPKTYFYDWLYINALVQNPHLAEQLSAFAAFSDIEFNPEKSINCQARSAALYVSLLKNNALNASILSPQGFLSVYQTMPLISAAASENVTLFR